MNEILNQDEVDALLKGVADGEIETETDRPPAGTDEVVYDLTNPERVIQEKMAVLGVIHDKFVKSFQASLAAMLRRDVDVQVLSREVMKYNRFIETLPLPASLSIMRVEPHDGVMIFEMDAQLVFSLMDILCGGTGSARFKVEGRDFTAIEQRIIEKVVVRAAEDLAQAWEPVVPLRIALEKTEINPRFVTVLERSETLIVYTFEVAIEQASCSMKLCIPYAAVEPFRDELSGEGQAEKAKPQDRRHNAWLRERLKTMRVQLVVEVGRGTLTFRDLLRLQVGDVIPLERERGEPLVVRCEGVPKFLGDPGQHRDRLAVRVRSVVREGGE